MVIESSAPPQRQQTKEDYPNNYYDDPTIAIADSMGRSRSLVTAEFHNNFRNSQIKNQVEEKTREKNISLLGKTVDSNSSVMSGLV